jgi:UDP-N-acetylmuramate: L-alanyl-gamma-D-glutamyl-meso-diaminopimelate ligase
MHVHILGICGTFMAGIASLARELGHQVSGSDENAWPPMSDQLRAEGIDVLPGYAADHLEPAPDQVIVGNALTRGMPVIEHLLNSQMDYTSGPAWLADNLLRQRWVLAVSGTHGKTTTSAMLAWILDWAGMNPGFLIGGVPQNFNSSARIGSSPFFVIEADEYDTAFFDKRSKFVHYYPRTLVINNIEHDHVDIFPDLASIIRQFHHLVRILPSQGGLIHGHADKNVEQVLAQGCWTPRQSVGDGGDWTAKLLSKDGSRFDIYRGGKAVASIDWDLIGQHNVHNALSAVCAAAHAGVIAEHAGDALGRFKNVKRRLETCGQVGGITVYDDFAHHPTAIQTTLAGLRAKVGTDRILALLDPRSASMRMGLHGDTLAGSLKAADRIWLHSPAEITWNTRAVTDALGSRCEIATDVQQIVTAVANEARCGDHLLVMSNGSFGGIHEKLLQALGTLERNQ